MDIVKKTEGTTLEMVLNGRIDTTTAPVLESELNASINGVTALVLDFTGVQYISSAGLRILLAAQKMMNKQGSMVLRGVNDDIKDVFEITGFIDILTLE